MDEKTARTRWCPMVRITLETEHWKAMNNREEVLKGDKSRSNCIASDCMMWRWEKGTATVNGVLHENVQLDIGYCGLSGRGE